MKKADWMGMGGLLARNRPDECGCARKRNSSMVEGNGRIQTLQKNPGTFIADSHRIGRPGGWPRRTTLDALGREIVLRDSMPGLKGSSMSPSTTDGLASAHSGVRGGGLSGPGRTLGLNVLRPLVNLSGMEPVQGEFNTAYFDSMLATIRGWAHGVYTLWIFTRMPTPRKLRGRAPLWAIVPEPAGAPSVLRRKNEERRLSAQVLAAFESSTPMTGSRCLCHHGRQARRGAPGRARVMGIDLMNEPVVLYDLDLTEPGLLDAFTPMGEAIRDVAPTMTLVFEPNSIRIDAWMWRFPTRLRMYSPTSTPMSSPMGVNRNVEKLQISKPPRTRRTNTEPSRSGNMEILR